MRTTIEAASRGEPAAIDAYYRAEHPLVYRLCFGFLADAHDADDAAQDAMLKLLDRLPTFDPARPYAPWRNAVVLNHCRDVLRRRSARRRAEDAAAARAPSPLPSPASAIHAAEVQAIVRGALARLSPREREAFVLRDLQGEPTADVATAMGVTAGTVRSLLTLARRRLRRELGPSLARTPDARGGGTAAR